MKNQHTPGPWKVGSGTDGTMTIEATDGREACILAELTECVSDDEDRANFALMAAAPELLQALKWVEWSNCGFCPQCTHGPVIGHAPKCVVGMAIAKAEGRP